MKISVIIPVFRVENTLSKCVDSVLAQDFADYEIILVDDGSDDKSPQICDAYASAHTHISVIHKANAGLGAARNTGIDAASGEYLMFIDSDDYISQGTMMAAWQFMDAHRNVDLAEFGYTRVYADGREERHTFEEKTYHNPTQYFYSEQVYKHSYAWNKIYRRKIFSTVRFVEGKKFEDMHTLPLILDMCGTVATISSGQYMYIDNASGITATAGQGLSHLLEAHSAMMSRTHWNRPDGITRHDFATYYAHILNIQIDVYEICGHTMPLMPRKVYLYTAKLILAAILGIRNTCLTFKLIHTVCRHNR